MNGFLLALLALVILFNVVASMLVLRAKYFDRTQKRNQLVLIWLLPVIGSLLCFFVIRETNRTAKPSSKSSAGSASTPGIGSYYD